MPIQTDPRCIKKEDLVKGLAIEALVNNTWKVGVLKNTRQKGGLAIKIVDHTSTDGLGPLL